MNIPTAVDLSHNDGPDFKSPHSEAQDLLAVRNDFSGHRLQRAVHSIGDDIETRKHPQYQKF